MSTVDRLTCPYCRTLLNPGAFVCHGCGAVRGHQSPSFLLMVLVFPVLAAIVTIVMFGVLGEQRMSAGGIFLVFGCSWAGFCGLHLAARSKVAWARGAAASAMVVDEIAPEIRRESIEDKTCPRCAETVKRAASVCRFCGFDFNAPRTIGGSGPSPGGASPTGGSPPGGPSGPIIDLEVEPEAGAKSRSAPAERQAVVIWPSHETEASAYPPPPVPWWREHPVRNALLGVAAIPVAMLGYKLGAMAYAMNDAKQLTTIAAPAYSPLAASAAPSPAPSPPLDRPQILVAQKMLAGLGYDVGAPDGVAGAKTRAAVKVFRLRAGIGGEGIDEALLVALTRTSTSTR